MNHLSSQTNTVRTPTLLRLDPHLRKVLLVEDELGFKTTIDHVLHSINPHLDPVWVTSVEEAMRLLRREKFDMIVADYRLNGPRTGLDLWHLCRRRHPDTPFLMISGMGVSRFLELTRLYTNRPAFLPKPFKIRECRDIFSALLGLHEGIRHVPKN